MRRWIPWILLASCGPAAGPHYDRGRQAAVAGRMEEARGHFEKAIAADAEMTEAWYWLGACKARLAVRAAKDGLDDEALSLFRAAVDDKRKARELMDRGVFRVWTPEERARARRDVEAGLEDVDELTDDEILEALRRS